LLVFHNVFGRESENGEAAAPQIVVARFVVALRAFRAMRDTVNFDNQTRVDAYKIDDVGADLHLLAKVVAVGAERMQQMPHAHFGKGWNRAELLGEGSGLLAPLPSSATDLRS
jgi:hypothetical protein